VAEPPIFNSASRATRIGIKLEVDLLAAILPPMVAIFLIFRLIKCLAAVVSWSGILGESINSWIVTPAPIESSLWVFEISFNSNCSIPITFSISYFESRQFTPVPPAINTASSLNCSFSSTASAIVCGLKNSLIISLSPFIFPYLCVPAKTYSAEGR